jgi:hypothetical protein
MSKRVRGHHEVIIPHSELQDPQTITERNERAFAELGSDIHTHEVVSIEDCHETGRRHMRIKMPRTFVDLGARSHR